MKLMKQSSIISVFMLFFLAPTVFAQIVGEKHIQINSAEYQKLKEDGALNPLDFAKYNFIDTFQVIKPIIYPNVYRKSNILCDFWIAPDSSYTLAMSPNDDGSSNLINLPFSFCL